MNQKGKTLQDEIHEVINALESDNTCDGWLSTNHEVEAVSDFEMFSEQLDQVVADPHRWKWTIIALHSGLQGMMVSALKGSHGLNVLHDDDKKRWLAWYRGDQDEASRPRNLRLASFLDLYRKIKGREMEMYCHSRRFMPSGTQGRSIKQLNRLRNEFVHFTPKNWLLDLEGLPAMISDCLEIAEFLAWESGNVFFVKPDLYERLKAAFASAHESLSALQQKTE